MSRNPSDILPDTPVYDYKAHYASVKALWDKYPLRTEEATDKHVVRLMRPIRGRLRRPIDDDALLALAMDMSPYFYADRIYFEEFPYWLSSDELKQLQHDLCSERIDAATGAIVDLCVGILNNFVPDSAFDNPESATGAVRVPLIELARDPKELLSGLIGFFAQKIMPGTDRLLFPNSWAALYKNLCLASGIAPDNPPAKPRLTFPADSDLAPTELVRTYLRDTGLEDYLLRPVAFAIPEEARYGGHWIVAPPGRGKTTLLHAMVMEDLQKDATVILMDSKGDLIEPIRELKQIENRLIIVDADPHHPIAINPLDIPKADLSLAVSNLEYVFSSLLELKMTPLQTVLFRSVLRALITSFPNPTLETFRDILTNGIGAYKIYIDKLPKDLQDFFSKEFNTKVYEDRRKEIIWRLRLLLENDTMRGMMLALRTRFNIGEAMDAGKVIIIHNSKAKLGDQGAEFFGRFFIAQVLAAAQQRSGRRSQDKKPVYFYIDECQTVIARDERIPVILDECRSQRVALILAHQRCEQITSPNVMSALSNCAIRYANSDDEARALAPKLRTNPEFLYSLKRGHFAAFVRDMTSHAIAFQVSKTDFSKLPQLSAGERAVLAARMQTDYGVLPEAAPADFDPRIDPNPPDMGARRPDGADKPKAGASTARKSPTAGAPPAADQSPPRPPKADPSIAGSTTKAPEPPPAGAAADANDPQTGEHTEPAAKWGEK